MSGSPSASIACSRIARSRPTRPCATHSPCSAPSAVEGSAIKWVTDHRKHHDFADEDGDPHTPHGGGPGVVGAARGLWHAHLGWLFTTVGQADRRRYGADLLKDRGLRLIDAAEKPLILASLAIPFLLGLAIKGSFTGALLTLVWGGLLRIFLLHHATFSINSICHFFGRRRYATDDESTNVGWLSLLTFGESWHNNHRAFPTSAFHGLRRREFDPGGLFIRGLEQLGLAWDVPRVSPRSPSEEGHRSRGVTRAASRATASTRPAVPAPEAIDQLYDLRDGHAATMLHPLDCRSARVAFPTSIARCSAAGTSVAPAWLPLLRADTLPLWSEAPGAPSWSSVTAT